MGGYSTINDTGSVNLYSTLISKQIELYFLEGILYSDKVKSRVESEQDNSQSCAGITTGISRQSIRLLWWLIGG